VKQRHIQEYVTKILDSPRRDVFAEDTISVKASTVLKMILASIEENTEDDIKIDFSLDDLDLESVKYKLKKLNFSVLVEDLVRNATKHSDQLPDVKCLLQQKGFQVKIRNRVKPACIGFVQQFIADLTSSTKEEILKRKGEGLLLIRTTSENLGANITAVLGNMNEEVVITITLGEYNEKKILFFEDQFDNIKSAVDWANRKDFQNTLEVDCVVKTDEKYDFAKTAAVYDVIFVDIELANRSCDDGIGVINKLIAASGTVKNKIVVISGHSEVKEFLSSAGLSKLPVLEKPISKAGLVFEIMRVLKLP